MKKNVLVLMMLIVSVLFSAFAEEKETDISLYNELSAAYNSCFYPGAVSYAERLESMYPDSIFSVRSLLMQGESLVRLGRDDDALPVLERALKVGVNSPGMVHECRYWIGRAQFMQGKYKLAAVSFYDSCEIAGSDGLYYDSAVLYGARACYAMKSYAQAVPGFEYVVSNGIKYAVDDYEEALLKLCDSYNQTEKYADAVSLFKSYPADSLSPDVYNLLSLYAGDSYTGLHQYRNAYLVYSTVLESGNEKSASTALMKAYSVSANHRTEVGTDSGDVLARAQKTLSDSPALMSEFWVRSGIDAYNHGEYDKAKEYFSSAGTDASAQVKKIIPLYLAEICFNESDAVHAFKYLGQAEKSGVIVPSDSVYDCYCMLMQKYAALQGGWSDVLQYGQKIHTADTSVLYYTAVAYYNTGDYKSAENAALQIYTQDSEADIQRLYGLILARENRHQESLTVFKNLEKSGKMTDEARLDFSRILLLDDQYAEAYKQAAGCADVQASYIAGIAAFDNRQWDKAEQNLRKYLASKPDTSVYNQFALFYQGYAQYRSGKSADAYTALTEFQSLYPENGMCWNACFTAACAAIQNGRNDLAQIQAEQAVLTAPDRQSAERAALLCTGIYSDTGAYAKAEALLQKYIPQRTQFGRQCAYELARLYVRQGDTEKADAEYLKIAHDYPADDIAEESMYRRGEVYYTVQNYDMALDRFGEYDKQYPDGRYSDASWYFSADCQYKKGNTSRAIMQNTALIRKYPDSPYIYGALKNLLQLYKDTGDYEDALSVSEQLTRRYGDQAAKDGIPGQIQELKKLASGTDIRIIKKQEEYDRLGRLGTADGRHAGTELVKLYMKSDDAKGTELALELFQIQKNHLDHESLDAADNAFVIAGNYRRKGNNIQSADTYLLSAKYYRMNGKDDPAAAALYNAADAFTAAGKNPDADETIKTLRQLYPQSRQAKALNYQEGKE